MEDLFPYALLAATSFAIKFLIDAFEDVLPKWAKIVMSLVISGGFVAVYRIDALAATMSRDPCIGGYVLTALLLAGVTSKVVHPLVDAVRANGK